MRPASVRNLLALAALTPLLSAQSSRPSLPASRPAAAKLSPARAGRTEAAAAEARVRRDEERRTTLHREQVGRELSGLFVKLGSPIRSTSREARDAIIDLCSRERIDGVGYQAERAFAWYWEYWAAQATAVLELRLQKTTLLGFDTVPVSLGMGGIVRLQLPRMQSIGIGTTVPVPLGR